MAHNKEVRSYGEAICCPLCFGLLVDPVLVNCDCNFCRSCIVAYREAQGGFVCCPQCGENAPELTLLPNHVLRNVVDKIRSRTSPQEVPGEESGMCEEHEEKLTLICETDGMLICSVCRDSKLHKQHKFMEQMEFLTTCKNKGLAFLTSLNQRVVSLKDAVQKQELEIARTKGTGCKLICHIATQFADLHQFLNEQERQLMDKLEAQVESNLAAMERNLTKMQAVLFSAELDITNIQAKLDRRDMTSLKDISCWQDRFSEDTPTAVSGNVCLGTFKGPLQYKIWKEMKEILHPVPLALSLDPETANPWLQLSDDLTSVCLMDTKQLLSDNLARFDVCVSVLATEGFTAGTHYWEVEVSDKSKWDIGVARESINRKGDISLKPENGYLALSLNNGNQYCALSSPTVTMLSLRVKPSRIGVYLDYEGGQVSFYAAEDLSHLYTFTEMFAERMFPFFCPCLNDTGDNGNPLSVALFS
uniref:zinc-binding protein A33-like n=1 Tax=Pristiophorus japonicus TaxID=55135 RepID=UPI00398E7F62